MKNYNNTNIAGKISLKLEKNRLASRGHKITNLGTLSWEEKLNATSDWSSGREGQNRSNILCTEFSIYCFPLKGN